MSTAHDLLLGAYGQSSKNQPTRIATEAAELLRVVNTSLKGCYAIAGRVNPVHFATSASVAFSGGWPIPAGAESVFLIKRGDGTEVVPVPIDDLHAETGKPAVYLLGRSYQSAGNPLDPTSENLTLYYARRHPTLTALSDSLDASWDSDFDNLPILDIATYLAQKDGRADEAAALLTAVKTWLALFVAHVEHRNVGEHRRFGSLRYANPSSLASLASMLVSGGGGGA